MHAKILSMVAVCGLLIGSTALAQAQPSGVSGPRAQGGESHRTASAVVHQAQKPGDVRGGRGASKSARGRITGVGAGEDKTTGFGGRDSDGFRQDLDEPATGEGHLRGDRASGMMDNVRRDDDGTSE
jgi:hypothetical protein